MTEDYNILTKKERENRHKPINLTNLTTKEDSNQQKIKPKHSSGGQQVGKFFIQPLSNRKRKRSIGDEDLDILNRHFGCNGDGVSLVDSREYDGGGLR